MSNKTAALVLNLPFNGASRQSLYRFDPPHEGNEFCVVSATDVFCSGPETYIFPSDASGKITDWGELDGSIRGTLKHEDAISEAGYIISEQET
jgi:hypothetical protein